MLAPTHPQPAAIEGKPHVVECAECRGSGRHIVELNGGTDARDRGACSACGGEGKILALVHPEDCRCEACLSGFWFFRSPSGEHNAIRFEMLKDALRAGAGEITKRDRLTGAHSRVAVIG